MAEVTVESWLLIFIFIMGWLFGALTIALVAYWEELRERKRSA